MQGGSLLGRTFGDNGGKQEGSRTEQREKLNCAPVETEDSADTARMFETWMAFQSFVEFNRGQACSHLSISH